ncbi:MAG: argininosuccinate lyase [Bacteroidetes bacterium]|nr:MAG: argininosuccinate lyase [Bacteroidota bacterium]
MKLWKKKISVNKQVEKFTIGKDRELDLLLAEHDVTGSMAHAKMLAQVGLLKKSVRQKLHKELKNILQNIKAGRFKIEQGTEDIHSQIEFLLTKKLGNIGKQIHTARSRNDQVLLDVVLFSRTEIKTIVRQAHPLFSLLIQLSEKHKKKLLPGYTHLQVAMPSSFGLWFGAYAESIKEDIEFLFSVYGIINKNPLGSAAGYGTSLPIKRKITTQLLGFDGMNHNSVYAQMTRGRTEKLVSTAMALLASTLAKMAMDICLFMNQNFGFVSFPENLTTGSSIMPHKKNPDVFELIRGKCNRLQTVPQQMTSVISNLPSGYHREFQLLKEIYFPAFGELKDCLTMMNFMLRQIQAKDNIMSAKSGSASGGKDEKYKHIFSVDAVNELVKKGIPFRDAYKRVGEDIASDNFIIPKNITYTHEGSIGNLQNSEIRKEMNGIMRKFNQKFRKVDSVLGRLLK